MAKKLKLTTAKIEQFEDTRVDVETPNMSCGVRTINGVDDLTSEASFLGACDASNLHYRPIVLFSSTKGSKGFRFVESFIKKHKLGALTKTKFVKNPASGNLIAVLTWTPNRVKVEALILKYSDAINAYYEEK